MQSNVIQVIYADMKAYTDIEQSKKLAKILSIESADMFYYKDAVAKEDNPRVMDYSQVPKNKSMYHFPCWSLAALLNIIPQEIFDGDYIINITEGGTAKWAIGYDERSYAAGYFPGLYYTYNDSLVDACVEIIIKLHEQNLL